MRTLLYFSISGLDLLGKLDEIDREACVEYIYSFQSDLDDHGGFYGYPKAVLSIKCSMMLKVLISHTNIHRHTCTPTLPACARCQTIPAHFFSRI